MREVLKEYFLPHLIWIALLFAVKITIIYLGTDDPNIIRALLTYLVIVPILTLFVGGMFYFSEEIYIPRALKRMNKNRHFLAFLKKHHAQLDLAYQDVDRMVYTFQHRGFELNTEVSYDFQKGCVIELTAWVNSEKNTFPFVKRYRYEYDGRANLPYVTKKLISPFGFIRKEEKITVKMNHFIDDLIAYKFTPKTELDFEANRFD